jgi:hypothetical protein
MKRPETIIIAVSVGLTVLFALLFGFAGSSIIGTFWGWFWITILVLVISFAVINSYLIQRDSQTTNSFELEALKEISKISIRLSCSYCQQNNNVPIVLNKRNTFKCESCNQANGVTMQFMSTALTSPLDSVNIPVDETTAVFKV